MGDAVAATAASAAAGVVSAGAGSAPTASCPFMEMVHLLVPPCLEKSQLIWVIFGNLIDEHLRRAFSL